MHWRPSCARWTKRRLQRAWRQTPAYRCHSRLQSLQERRCMRRLLLCCRADTRHHRSNVAAYDGGEVTGTVMVSGCSRQRSRRLCNSLSSSLRSGSSRSSSTSSSGILTTSPRRRTRQRQHSKWQSHRQSRSLLLGSTSLDGRRRLRPSRTICPCRRAACERRAPATRSCSRCARLHLAWV